MPTYKNISTVLTIRNKKFENEILNDTVYNSFKSYEMKNQNEILLHIRI